MLKKFFVLFLLLVFTVSVFAGCSKNNIQKNTPEITLEEYEKIEKGMPYEQVVEIIGSEGELLTENRNIKKYVWTNKSKKLAAMISFLEGKVRGKFIQNGNK